MFPLKDTPAFPVLVWMFQTCMRCRPVESILWFDSSALRQLHAWPTYRVGKNWCFLLQVWPPVPSSCKKQLLWDAYPYCIYIDTSYSHTNYYIYSCSNTYACVQCILSARSKFWDSHWLSCITLKLWETPPNGQHEIREGNYRCNLVALQLQ